MNPTSKIAELEQNNAQLNRDISNAGSNWSDSVKESFFNQHILSIQQILPNQIEAMQKLAREFEEAEKKIEELIKKI